MLTNDELDREDNEADYDRVLYSVRRLDESHRILGWIYGWEDLKPSVTEFKRWKVRVQSLGFSFTGCSCQLRGHQQSASPNPVVEFPDHSRSQTGPTAVQHCSRHSEPKGYGRGQRNVSPSDPEAAASHPPTSEAETAMQRIDEDVIPESRVDDMLKFGDFLQRIGASKDVVEGVFKAAGLEVPSEESIEALFDKIVGENALQQTSGKQDFDDSKLAFSTNLFDMDVEPEVLMTDDVDFEVALDSGCVQHVCDEVDTPGYQLEESEGSRRGANFIVGNGSKIPNRGQVNLKLEADNDQQGINALTSTFQIAKVTRPLMSVSRICDGDMTATFDKHKAIVRDASGKVVCVFRRQGGLYVCRMKLKAPFGGRGR